MIKADQDKAITASKTLVKFYFTNLAIKGDPGEMFKELFGGLELKEKNERS